MEVRVGTNASGNKSRPLPPTPAPLFNDLFASTGTLPFLFNALRLRPAIPGARARARRALKSSWRIKASSYNSLYRKHLSHYVVAVDGRGRRGVNTRVST